jgi:prepilin-type N-terminal cleavage/methylation domain-containing protein
MKQHNNVTMKQCNLEGFTPTPNKLYKIHPSISKKYMVWGFTLLELLIVIGILAVLATTVVLVINPGDLLARSRDSRRISDLSTLNSAINLALISNPSLSLGTPNTIYVSLPSDQPDCSDLGLPSHSGWTYHCATQDNLTKTNGDGWIPINFTQMDIGSPISHLPLDPKNTYIKDLTQSNDFFFTYAVNSSNQWELNAKTESSRFGFTDRDGFPIVNAATTPINDGGDNGLYEIGSNLTIIPDSGGLCPSGMVYVPAPARICIDKYEASYSASGIKPDGTSCSANCPLSVSSANPWTTRSGWPSVSQITAKTYCENMGKVLPTDYEWFIASSGTPDPHISKPVRISGNEGPEPCMIWNTSNTDGIVERPQGSTQCSDGYVWGSDTNPNIKTGTASKCISTNGAYDMIGNVWEWVNDTKSTSNIYSSGNTAVPTANQTIAQINDYGVPVTSGGTSCSGGKCNNDYYWVASGVLTAGLRSGGWGRGAPAGRFALLLNSAPGGTSSDLGFRCALR